MYNVIKGQTNALECMIVILLLYMVTANHSSPNIVRVIKLRRMRYAGHVALMGEGRGV
jgi:hypothetical protein